MEKHGILRILALCFLIVAWDCHSHVISWWTPFIGTDEFTVLCADKTCIVSGGLQNSNQIQNVSVIIYYGTDFKPFDLPIPRQGQVWALLHEESPKNNPLLCNPWIAPFFNYSATYSRFSDVSLALSHLQSLAQITDLKYFVSVSKKNQILSSEGIATVIYIQSACDAPSQRDAYVMELMKYIPIDAYGKCLHNRELPERLRDPVNTMEDAELYQLISKYKYAIAFENAVAEDYITEKLWRPIELGVVPIYLGSPSVKDWLPDEKAAILISEFDNPAELANYLTYLNSNDTAYNEHLDHKLGQRIHNSKLVEAFNARPWNTDNGESFVDAFHCFLCEEAYKIESARQKNEIYTRTVDPTVFTCPIPVNPITKKADPNSWWTEYFVNSILEGDVMYDFLEKDEKYGEDEFRDEVIRRLSGQHIRDEL